MISKIKYTLFLCSFILLLLGCSDENKLGQSDYDILKQSESGEALRPSGKEAIYFVQSLTGGASGSLDSLDITGAGSPNTYDLMDGDSAIYCTISGSIATSSLYTFDADGTDAESSPTVIRPDDYATQGVWRINTVVDEGIESTIARDSELIGGSWASPGAAIGTGTPVAITGTMITATTFSATRSTSGPDFSAWYEDDDNGDNYVGWGSPAINANDLILLGPISDPLANQILIFAAPASVTFRDAVARDAAQATWGYTGYMATASKATAYTAGTDDPREVYGGTIYVTSAAIVTLPAIAAGMSVSVVTIGAIAVSVDTNAADRMYLDGVALDDGDKATNTSTIGDMIVCTYESSSGWYCASGSPDGDHWTDGGP